MVKTDLVGIVWMYRRHIIVRRIEQCRRRKGPEYLPIVLKIELLGLTNGLTTALDTAMQDASDENHERDDRAEKRVIHAITPLGPGEVSVLLFGTISHSNLIGL